MMKVTNRASVSLLVLGLMLAGCGGGGGGGGGGVNSTPTPIAAPPPSGANSDLLGTLKSESFANTAANATANFAKDGSSATVSGGVQNNVSFVYDASQKSYSITAGGKSITFTAADIDQSQSNAQVTVYVKKSGSTTDSLTLTKAGTSGHLTFQYVGAGYWQQTTDTSTSISGFIDSITYGEPTSASAVPSSGLAQYPLDFLGAETEGNSLEGFVGTGNAEIDFGTGLLKITGDLSLTGGGSLLFTGNGKIDSASGGFSGSFQANASGQLAGQFYGPNAQEIGGSFAGGDSSIRSAISGTFMGRKGADPNLAFDASAVNSDSAALARTYDSATGKNTNLSTPDVPVIVQYDVPKNEYTLIDPELSFTLTDGRTSYFAFDSNTLSVVNTSYNDMTVLHWIERHNLSPTDGINGESANITEHYLVFGNRTPDANIPTSGMAGYDVDMSGNVLTDGNSSGVTIYGKGTLYVDFAKGTVDTTGVANLNSTLEGFHGSANLTASANGFTGTMAFDTLNYSGSWSGHFYGTSAGELGSAYMLTDGNGTYAAGLLLGESDPVLTQPVPTLADLPGPTTFLMDTANTDGGNTYLNYASLSITYDPTKNTYSIPMSDYTLYNFFDLNFGPADLVKVNSDSSYNQYHIMGTTGGGATSETADIRMINSSAGNPTVQLSYMSFGDILLTTSQYPGSEPTVLGFAWGNQTPSAQLPPSGSATYRGALIGSGYISPTSGAPSDYQLSGTDEFDIDFTHSNFTGNFSVQGTGLNGAADRDFGTLNFYQGQISNDLYGPNSVLKATLQQPDGTSVGGLSGSFYGPHGAELGGIFDLNFQSSNEKWTFAGAFGAAKTP